MICSTKVSGQETDSKNNIEKNDLIQNHKIALLQLYKLQKKRGFEKDIDSIGSYLHLEHFSITEIKEKNEALKEKIEKEQKILKAQNAQRKIDEWSQKLEDEDDLEKIVKFAAIIKKTGANISITDNIIICSENGNEHVILFSEKDKETFVTYSENK